MPGSAEFIQRAVHALEAGALAVWMRRALILAVAVGIALFYLIHEFRGLATSQAMDQAQIGRELARGHGWRTNFIRPRAIGQLQGHGKNVPRDIWSDTYNAPIPPLIDALALLPVKARWKMKPQDIVYVGDRAIAVSAVLLFFASTGVLFFAACRLFDRRLALLGCGLVLMCDAMWQYSISGLPQMLLLFLFHVAVYLIIRAVQAHYAGGPTKIWLGAIGLTFGLLALSHALTIWIFVAALIFFVFFFRPRGWGAAIMLLTFAAVYTPWLVRNWAICGHPGGVAIFSLFGYSEIGHMRRIAFDLEDVNPGFFRNKISANVMTQSGRIVEYLGWSVVAAMFFTSLLHSFRRAETAILRWMILVMWFGAFMGMATYGIHEEQGVAANQLNILFIPMMTCFGLAYLLVQWNRLNINVAFARAGFLTLLYVLCAVPMLSTMLLAPRKAGVRWPPYVPPYIAVLNEWMKPEEIIASDMPWAIAWYADRRGLWLPESIKVMTDLSDFNVIGAPINGLYLTPISGTQNTLGDILKGDYKDWSSVLMRTFTLDKFPLKWWTPLIGLDGECLFFSDHERQHAPAK
jgi:hypothetical protein